MPTLAVYLHALNPYAIKLWDEGPIRWYGLSYLLGFFLAFLIIRRIARVGVSPIKPQAVGDLVVWLAIGVVLGGRLGYVLFYDPHLLAFDGRFPYWGVLRLNEGGMASHGGMIGGIVASWLYARQQKVSWAYVLDLFAFGAPLGLFFGRIANFVNGELYGRPCSPKLPWGVKFPQEMYRWDATQILDLAPVLRDLPPPAHAPPANLSQAQIIYDSIPRIITAIQNHNPKVIAAVEPLLTTRHPSQLYEALLEGLLLFTVLAIVWAYPRKPLVVGSTFAMVYALVRIYGERFRMPDAQIANQEFEHFNITRGQLLSVFLLAAGVVMWLIARQRPVEKLGGWLRRPGAKQGG